MARSNEINRPLVYTGLYAVLLVTLQIVLGLALPNAGMGGLGVTYLVWPAIIVSIAIIYWILRRLRSGRALVTCVLILIGSAALIAVYPQDDQSSFQEKVRRVVMFVASK